AFFTTLPDGLAEWTAEERALFLPTTRALAAASPRRARILYRELPPAIGKLPADARAALLRALARIDPRLAAPLAEFTPVAGAVRSLCRRQAGRVAETRPDALGRAGRGARRGGRDPPPAAGGPSRRARGRAPAPRRLAADARGQLPRLPPPRRPARRAARVRHLRAPRPARRRARPRTARGPLPPRRGRARAPPARGELPGACRRGALARHAAPRALGPRARAVAHGPPRRAPAAGPRPGA